MPDLLLTVLVVVTILLVADLLFAGGARGCGLSGATVLAEGAGPKDWPLT